MKSREGTVVDADDLIEEMRQLAEDEIRRRDTEDTLSDEEIQNRAFAIGLAAIKFYLLRARPELSINFDRMNQSRLTALQVLIVNTPTRAVPAYCESLKIETLLPLSRISRFSETVKSWS